MFRADARRVIQVGDRACDFQYPIVRSRAQPHPPHYRKLLEDFVTGDGLPSAGSGTATAETRFSARKITALRQKLGLTKAALARQIGVNVNTLSRWERGDRKPHGLHWKLIADLMKDPG